MRTGALGGLSFISRLRLHDTRTPILVFSMHNDPFIVSRALKIGANGYILKDTPSEEIIKAFEKVRDGTPYLSHELASEVAFMESRGRPPIRCAPSPCASCRSCRCSPKASPTRRSPPDLHVSYKTIANTCSQLKTKLGVRSLPELMRIAIEYLPSGPGKSFKDD